MRLPILLLLSASALFPEIHDVAKSADIDAMLSRLTPTKPEQVLHQTPNYSLWLELQDGKPGPQQNHPDSDDIWVIRRGSARLTIGDPPRRHQIGRGDLVRLPRHTPYQIDPGSGRLEYVALRIFPTGEDLPARAGIRPATGKMSDVLKKPEIDETFAKFTSNQPIHTAKNFTMNYVIYSGRSGPWEAHRGCVDIYFLQIGAATAQLGGEIENAKEETPGEPRGDGVKGAREHQIGPGDIVLIPRNTAHHMTPAAGQLGYILVKVWVD